MSATDLSRALKKLRVPLEEWRRAGRRPRTIPAPIWEQATELAAKHSVGAVARGLGLDHAKLKSLVDQHCPEAGMTPVAPASAPPMFLEFLQSQATTNMLAPCLFHVDSQRGSRLTVEVGGLDPSGLATVLREFGG